jgi:hypothetical protein
MKFKGSIIITDPCYIIKEGDNNDWDKCEHGSNMQAIGIKTFIVKDTEWGDWQCKTNSDNGNVIGQFCADAGLVGVFLLDEVLAYNPSFDLHKTKKFTTTLIENFEGEVEIIHKDTGVFELGELSRVSVVGKGNVNFHTEQIGY